jgi:hypothetical protein
VESYSFPSVLLTERFRDGEIKHEMWILQIEDLKDIRLKPLLNIPLRERTFYISIQDDTLVMASPLESAINLQVINIGEAKFIARFCVTVAVRNPNMLNLLLH